MSTPKESMVTVMEDIENQLDKIQQFEKLPLTREYDSKISQLLPTSFSSSEESEIEESDTDGENNLDLPEDGVDPDETLEAEKINDDKPQGKDQGSFRGRPSSCVFVASLAASLSDDELSISVTKHFEKWGELALVKVLRDPSNRPYAFVQYANDVDAKLALKEGQHSVLNGRTIRCEPAKVNRTLYIATFNGLEITLKEIKEVLESFGEIEQIIGNNDSSYRKSNLNKAWFCKFAYRDDAIRAYANLRLSPDWIVEWAQNVDRPFEAHEKAEPDVEIDRNSIFVGQLDAQVTKELLNERFSKHGKILEIVLVIRPGNNFAFIKFATEQAAAAAVERENHAVFMDKTMHVQYRELHHKKNRFATSATPRLNLAPPPVNIPSRRASTGSGYSNKLFEPTMRTPMGQFAVVSPSNVLGLGLQKVNSAAVSGSKGSRQTKHAMGRSVSLSSDKFYGVQRFYSSSNSGSSKVDGVNYGLDQYHQASIKEEDNTFSTNNQHTTPLSSPSNHTMTSHGEAKSLYSASTVSALDHDSTNLTTSGDGSAKPLNTHRVRGINHLGVSQNSSLIPPAPSYYYYAMPKDGYIYDQNQYLAYPSYPYYYPESSLVEFPQQNALNAPGIMPPAPYYMYYGVPQTPNFDPKQASSDQPLFAHPLPSEDKEEINY